MRSRTVLFSSLMIILDIVSFLRLLFSFLLLEYETGFLKIYLSPSLPLSIYLYITIPSINVSRSTVTAVARRCSRRQKTNKQSQQASGVNLVTYAQISPWGMFEMLVFSRSQIQRSSEGIWLEVVSSSPVVPLLTMVLLTWRWWGVRMCVCVCARTYW